MSLQSTGSDAAIRADAEPGIVALYCPIPLAQHPNATAVQDRAFDRMERFRLFGDGAIPRENALATESARVTGSMLPDAPDDRLLLYVTYMYWGFMVDDLLDNGTPRQRSQRFRELAPRLMRVLESPLARVGNDPPPVALFGDIYRRIREFATPAQARLWADAFQAWLLGVALELDDSRRASLPSLDEYLFLKLYIGAVRTVTITVELCGGGGELPVDERESPQVKALTQAAGVLMNLYTDLFSHGKESADAYNIVNVLIRDTGGDIAAARREAVRLCDRIMVLFLTLREQTAPEVGLPTRTYLDNLATTLSAALQWSDTTARFAGGADRPRLVRADSPACAELTAPPCPSISWWWDQLESSTGAVSC
jgi:hypothetical protein